MMFYGLLILIIITVFAFISGMRRKFEIEKEQMNEKWIAEHRGERTNYDV